MFCAKNRLKALQLGIGDSILFLANFREGRLLPQQPVSSNSEASRINSVQWGPKLKYSHNPIRALRVPSALYTHFCTTNGVLCRFMAPNLPTAFLLYQQLVGIFHSCPGRDPTSDVLLIVCAGKFRPFCCYKSRQGSFDCWREFDSSSAVVAVAFFHPK